MPAGKGKEEPFCPPHLDRIRGPVHSFCFQVALIKRDACNGRIHAHVPTRTHPRARTRWNPRGRRGLERAHPSHQIWREDSYAKRIFSPDSLLSNLQRTIDRNFFKEQLCFDAILLISRLPYAF